MSDEETVQTTLLQWSSESKLKEAALSEDGQSLTLGDTTLSNLPLSISSAGGKTCQYTLASIFLQILDPDQGLLAYRNACKKYSVRDPVTALDKPAVVGFFLGSMSDSAAPATAAAKAAEPEEEARKEKKRKSKHDEHQRSRSKDKDHKHSSRSKDHHDNKGKKKKKEAKTVTDEQLLSNLTAVVGKRQDDTKTQEEITKALSAHGFEVTPEILAEYKPKAEYILANEIPVGNSASILRALNPNKSLSRVLELYMETVNPKSSKSSSKQLMSSTSNSRAHLIGKKPVIVVPKGMTAPITLLNAHEFLKNGQFVPRDVMMSQQGRQRAVPTTTFTRNVPNAGGNLLEYEIIDNPKKMLGYDLKEWDRIVAVIVLGQGWQFKDWPPPYNDAVQLFSRSFGYYIGMEGSKLPSEVTGWAVTQAQLNRDKRGMDKVTNANFWNRLDEWMAVNKRELLPRQEN
jgi:parafibromin